MRHGWRNRLRAARRIRIGIGGSPGGKTSRRQSTCGGPEATQRSRRGAPRLRWYDSVIARPRTIALATIEYPPDPLSAGIGSYVRTLARFLRDAGHQVHVVARAYAPAREEEDEQGITVHRVGPVRPDLPAGFEGVRTISFALRAAMGEWRYRRDVARTLERLVDHEGVELIEAADHLAEPIFYRSTRRPQVPFVVRLHTPLAFTEMLDPHLPGYARRVVGAIERAFIVRASHVSAPTRTAATAIRGVMRLDNVPVHVHANPVRFPERRPEPSTEPGDDAPERPTVLFVGRVCRLKGVHLLARALPDIVERVPDVRFDLVGSDHVPMDGHPDTRSWLLARLPERYHDHLRFHGHVPPGELGAIYRGATVCAFPSLFESFSYVCLEAMIHGKPVVGSSRGGMAELLDGGRAGVLVDPTEVDALAEAISGLLLDPERRRTLGDRARRRALESYGPDRVLRDIEAFYERAIDELA
ncbi:MAG: glycosyltransferase family 4 protein [Trueperaceae bacterium]|nr:glycosyltransferase family 4 protein [Trueperaceae bacterium]